MGRLVIAAKAGAACVGLVATACVPYTMYKMHHEIEDVKYKMDKMQHEIEVAEYKIRLIGIEIQVTARGYTPDKNFMTTLYSPKPS